MTGDLAPVNVPYRTLRHVCLDQALPFGLRLFCAPLTIVPPGTASTARRMSASPVIGYIVAA
jgi:hypothetical protein